MKISHIFYSLNYGGIETLIVNVANWQADKGHDVSVILISSIYEKSLIDAINSKVKVVYLGRRKNSKGIMAAGKLNLYLIKKQFDILHIHAAEIGNIILPILKSKRILHVHSTLGITNSVIPRYDKCIAISHSVKRKLELEYNSKNIVVLYNGVDFNKFIKKDSRIISNKIVCVGSLNIKIKNQDGIISEFSKNKDRIDADLHIIGDGPDYEILKSLIDRLHLNDRVFLLGKKSQEWIQQHLCGYDLFVQASHSEGLGIAAIEAAASCIPLLLSKIDGHIEISENGRLCELFDSTVEGDLAEKIIDFYDNSNIYFELAFKNYTMHKCKYNFDLYNKKLLNTYLSI